MALIAGRVINKRYEIEKRLGNGAFGTVYRAFDLRYEREVAIKVEMKSPLRSAVLLHERLIYERLWSKAYPIGIPRPTSFFGYGRSDLLVMPLLGCSLRHLWKANGCFSMKNICKIGIQMLNRLEHIHGQGILHLDIKPENMVIGRGKDAKTVYLIDYGLSGRYTDRKGVHLAYKEQVPFEGTPAFASVHVDSEVERSPRDDMESLMYSLVILHNGKLPWCGGDWKFSINYSRSIKDVKWDCRDQLCKGFPRGFQRAWKIVSSMDFGDTPRYEKFRQLFTQVAAECDEDDGLCFGIE